MAKTKTAKKTKAKPSPVPSAPAPSIGSQAAYEQYLPAAQALDAAKVVPLRADAALAYHNAAVGVASLLAQRAAAQALPGTDVDALAELTDECLALAFAVENADQIGHGTTTPLAPLLTQASALRRKLFAAADALVEADLLPASKVAALHAGRGKLDTAQDLVGLAALFTANASAIKGKTAITSADTTQAAKLGTQLLTLLKPSQARRTRPAAAVDAADVRNRLWTLVRGTYAELWRACAYVYGPDAIEARVPSLQSRTATTSKRKKANASKRAAKTAAKA